VIRLESSPRIPVGERRPTIGVRAKATTKTETASSLTDPEKILELDVDVDANGPTRRFPIPSSTDGWTKTVASQRLQSARDRLDSLSK
jgi:hypothetical protein